VYVVVQLCTITYLRRSTVFHLHGYLQNTSIGGWSTERIRWLLGLWVVAWWIYSAAQFVGWENRVVENKDRLWAN
jgi:hypothetical protein